ncbi:hypothetical protein ORI20_20535 [Mycobacterium sp. CVI_P3]|uniref:Uncharacterized protein n=1 Tax=Mycobacterium pinniadriaticum TaxID=2994102 RepID=A0ABT3SI90_9MYCO|nr:hypothetical protein [Mycobacterium pinniadriaticum]MCX2932663.1 hypothetical protein [Mycobacterium pinniadriaticum]MCX2939087.1 hypothetical protein [Mycobacterium pinniadriaticum]
MFQTDAAVTKVGSGFNINGVKVGGAAAIDNTGHKAAAHPAAHGVGGSRRT